MKTGIVVTGLPASGKTSVARAVASELGFAFFDKDDFLEDLYDKHPVKTWEDRKRLSRKSDNLFQEAVQQHGSAVLVSHWRPAGAQGESGTPTDWLLTAYDQLIEVCCLCPPQIAFERFIARNRHPGHFDKQRDPEELANRLKTWQHHYPLNIGILVQVRTDGEVDVNSLVEDIRTKSNWR